jgi:hypothetical protein
VDLTFAKILVMTVTQKNFSPGVGLQLETCIVLRTGEHREMCPHGRSEVLSIARAHTHTHTHTHTILGGVKKIMTLQQLASEFEAPNGVIHEYCLNAEYWLVAGLVHV